MSATLLIRSTALAALAVAYSLAAAPAAAEGVTGEWFTVEGESKVQIEPCGSSLCGKIVWLREPLAENGKPHVDVHNPDPKLRTRPTLGIQLIWGFHVAEDDPNHWINGKIYNPKDGETYSSTLTLQADETLKVRGYVGLPLFGKTQIWTRTDPQLRAQK